MENSITASNTAEPSARLMKPAAARAYLGWMSAGTFFQLRQKGVIPTIYVGRAVYFDRLALDGVIDALAEQS